MSLPCVRTKQTSIDKPTAPSHTTVIRKYIRKEEPVCGTTSSPTSKNIFNAINSKLNSILSRCFRLLTNPQSPIKTNGSTNEWTLIRYLIGYCGL